MTKEFIAETFSIPEVPGISARSVEEHIGLYQGYVKNWNALNAELAKAMAAETKDPHTLAELVRRSSFEFGGMRLHEYYFKHLEGGATPITPGSALESAINAQYGSLDALKHLLKNIGLMRGPGWAILYWDKKSSQFLTGFSGEQHQGHFASLPIVLALDVWEHTYTLDYGAQGKGKYIDAFLAAVNWNSCDKNFTEAQK